MYNPTKTMWQELKDKIQSEAPRYNLNNSISSNQSKIKSPPKTKNKYKECQKHLSYVLPLFVTECQRAIKIHHQKEVAMKNFETVPNLLADL